MHRRLLRNPWTAPAVSLLMIAALTALTACSALNPLHVAQTPEQKYAAVKLTYDALLTVAQTFVADQTIPPDARRAVQSAVGKSGELYKSLNTAFVEYVAAKSQLAAGATTSDKLNVATTNLATWVAQLEAAVGPLAVLLHR